MAKTQAVGDAPDVAASGHDHAMSLVAVDYDDAGHAVQEMRCPGCGETTFVC